MRSTLFDLERTIRQRRTADPSGSYVAKLTARGRAKIAQNLLGFRQDGMPAGYVQQRNSYFEAVTLEDVKRVAAAYMKPDNFTFVMVGKPTR